MSIHSFYVPASFHILGHRDVLEPIPAIKGREAGSTLDRSPAYCRANTQRQTDIHSHTPTNNLD